MTLARRRVVAGAVVSLAGVFSLAVATPAQAAGCSADSGVTVVIDTGSSISTRCAAGAPSSAMTALTSVASVTTPQRFPGSVVCRIDGVPADDPCVAMPPSTAYWSIWTASAGGSWSYATVGATSLRPGVGSVLGFRFGDGSSPRIAPPAAPRPTPAPSTQRPRGETPRPSGGSATRGAAPTAAPAAPRPTATATTPGPSASTSASRSSSASASPSRATPAPSVASSTATVAAPERSSNAGERGNGWGPSVAGVALLGLLGFAGLVTRAKR